MSKYLSWHSDEQDYDNKLLMFRKPHIGIVEGIFDNDVRFLFDNGNKRPYVEDVLVLFKTDMDDEYYSQEVDYGDLYMYSGNIDIDGSVYYKFRKIDAGNYFILTDTLDFSGISLDNPYTPVGWITADEQEMEPYRENDKIVDCLTTTVTFENRDIDSLDSNGHEYVDLDLPSGTLWATCNIGASTPSETGNLFKFGSTVPTDNEPESWAYTPFNNGSSSFDSAYFNAHKSEWFDGNTLKPEYDAANVLWGGDWHMPTKDQIIELIEFTYRELIENYMGTGEDVCVFHSLIDSNKYMCIRIHSTDHTELCSVLSSDLHHEQNSYEFHTNEDLSIYSIYNNYPLDINYNHYTFRCSNRYIRPVL